MNQWQGLTDVPACAAVGAVAACSSGLGQRAKRRSSAYGFEGRASVPKAAHGERDADPGEVPMRGKTS